MTPTTRKKDPGYPSRRAWARMDHETREQIPALAELVREVNVRDVRRLHLLGDRIRRIRTRYSRREAAEAIEYLAITAAEVMAGEKIASAFTATEAERLARLFMVSGSLLSADHLAAVADLSTRSERMAFLRRAQDEGIPARDLKRRVAEYRAVREAAAGCARRQEEGEDAE